MVRRMVARAAAAGGVDGAGQPGHQEQLDQQPGGQQDDGQGHGQQRLVGLEEHGQPADNHREHGGQGPAPVLAPGVTENGGEHELAYPTGMTTAAGLPRLTSLSHGAGCACKLPLATLERLMASVGQGLDGAADANLLVGAAEGDDAAVLRLDDERALVLTTDFFTPIVDDARDWGRIAAANALSDVYAMGGRPILALNLTAWPAADLPVELLAEVLRGGAEVAAEAGCPVVGVHEMDDTE